MPNFLQVLAAYVPPYILRTTLSTPSPTPPTEATAGRFPAAVLFADVSGFTPLTEALAQKGAEGPEELTRLLNGYFSRMIALVEAEGGEVVKFSGDAVTVIFPATREELSIAARRAKQAAEAMQAAMSEFSTLETSVGPVALGMKIGIGAGEVMAAQVGGVGDRWEYVIAGDPLRQVAQAEHQAERDQIALSPEAEGIILPQDVEPRSQPPPDWTGVQDPNAVEAVLRVYVPRVVIAWMEEELQEWLAVLRPMSVLFIGITGIDYTETEAVERLHVFMRAAQEIVQRYEGSINKLAVDDKGTISIILFGAPPHAHEDDPERALHCALELQRTADAQDLELAIGVTTGRVFAGPVGSETRREYTVMGDTVNLAARLMGVAGKGQVRCDYETYRNARARLAFDLLPSVRLKGKAGLFRLYSPTGEAAKRIEKVDSGVLVGRQAHVARLTACLDELLKGESRILIIEGEAGIGKSRMVEELVRLMRERGVSGLLGAGHSIEQQTPYRAWREIFGSYFDLDDTDDPLERRRRVQAYVYDVVPDLAERLPLLNDVLSLGIPENKLTASLDTHLRHESLVSLLLELLRAWASERPLVLVLEDAQWLDSLSWDLTLQAARALTVARMPVLLVVVMRPLGDELARLEPQALAGMKEAERMLLGSMSPQETLTLAAAKLGLTVDELPEAVAELVHTRAEGNPFFAEELMYSLRDNGHILIEAEAGKTRCVVSTDLDRVIQTLPDTIQGIVLSRIDRLPPDEQLTLKVAAVIGRTFAFTPLHDTLGMHMEVSQRLLKGHLDDLIELELTPLDAPEPELTYIFKHLIIQEVAYETLLFAQRRQLHRTVARWYERNFGENDDGGEEEQVISPLAPYYPLLVYHWHQAEDRERERHYAGLAGKWAAAQYANEEAVGYFSRALELTPETDLRARYDLLLAREAVYDLMGEREAQAQDLATLALLAEEMRDKGASAEIALRRANYMEVTSDYAEALIAVRRAIDLTAQTKGGEDDTEGYIMWGTVLRRQGNYAEAQIPLKQALKMARSAGDRRSEADSLHALGIVYCYQGDYTAAQEHFQLALNVRRADGHRQGEADGLSELGVIHYELGNYPTAQDYYEQALSIHRTTGDRRGETMILSNLGVVYCDMGDYEAARDSHKQALDLRLAIGDRWGEAVSLVNLGLVYHALEDDEAAREHCQRSLEIQREIGDQRGRGYSLTYLGHALAGLGELEAAAEAYSEAMRLRRELGQYGLAMDDLAGLARVALAQGDVERAFEHVEEILAWIEAHGSDTIEYPLQVYLTCYRVLNATEEPSAIEQAREIISQAHTILLERAASISDSALQHKFLEKVKNNREIIAAWEQSSAGF